MEIFRRLSSVSFIITLMAGAPLLAADSPSAPADDKPGLDAPKENEFQLAPPNRMLNRKSLTGLRRVTSATSFGTLRFSAKLSGEGSFFPNYVLPDDDATALARGQLSAAVGIYRLAEIGLRVQPSMTYSSSALTSIRPNTYAGVSLKLSPLGFLPLVTDFPMPVAVALIGDVELPTARDSLFVPDVTDVRASIQAALTLDLADSFDIPFRAHINAGYRLQGASRLVDANQRQKYFLSGQEHLAAVGGELWWYDGAFAAAGVEAPLPYVTPFLEVSYQAAVGVPTGRGSSGLDYSYLRNGHTIITPGVRVGPLAGISLELFADVGATGTAGYFNPAFAGAVDGQPLNPVYLVGASISFSLDALTPTKGRDNAPESQTTDSARPTVSQQSMTKVCILTDGVGTADVVISGDISGAEFAVTDASGCAELSIPEFPLSIRAEKNGHDVKTHTIADSSDVSLTMVKSPTTAPVSIIIDEPKAARGTVLLWNHATDERFTSEFQDGKLTLDVPRGVYTLHVQSTGLLRTGAAVDVTDGPLAEPISLSLKKAPKRRLAKRKNDLVTSSVKIPFSGGTATFLSAAPYVLDDIVDVLLEAEEPVVLIGIAAKESQKDLAQERVDAVAEYFNQHGISPDVMKTKVEVRKKSRRSVEIRLVPTTGQP